MQTKSKGIRLRQVRSKRFEPVWGQPAKPKEQTQDKVDRTATVPSPDGFGWVLAK
jgi:hypothetical protein